MIIIIFNIIIIIIIIIIITRNWCSSKIPLETKNSSQLQQFFLIVLKISLPSLDIPLKLLSFNTGYEKVQHVLDLHTCRIEILILILLNNQDKTSSSWNYIPIAARINDIWHVNR